MTTSNVTAGESRAVASGSLFQPVWAATAIKKRSGSLYDLTTAPSFCTVPAVRSAPAMPRFDCAPSVPGIGGAKLPDMPDDTTDPRARLEERATQIRHLIETLDLLYDAFGQQRLSKDRSDTLPKMQKWLTREERRAA